MTIDSNTRKILDAFAVFGLTVIAVDWISSALAQRFLGDVVYNSRPLLLLLAVAFSISFPFFLIYLEDLFRGSFVVIGSGLCYGGIVANFLSRLIFGPVADFIPVPFIKGMECDPADLAIAGGLIIVLASLVYLTYQNFRQPESSTLKATALTEASPAPTATTP
jgi:Na+-translocating ferredoxin:NAD+ oxidoreductase RnfD subunit